VTRFYTIDAANERLPEVRDQLERLRAQRLELIGLRDLAVERLRAVRAAAGVDAATSDEEAERGLVEGDTELRAIRLRMQGVIDQMQAAVTRLDEWDVTLRDIETGLIDFPALASGRQVWLCWRLGEGPIEWWHELTTGFDGRRPLLEMT
jgi:hypothetical protein